MSYRAFKRLLGESSLERKCRFLLGAGTLILISISFWLYGMWTGGISAEAMANVGRLLSLQVLSRMHMKDNAAAQALDEFQERAEAHWSDEIKGYKWKLYKPNAQKLDNKPDANERDLFERFVKDPDVQEDWRLLPVSGIDKFIYYGAVRAGPSCLK